MEIKTMSREFTKAEKYMMTLDNNAISVKDIEDGTVINVDGYLEYDDINSKGEEVHILSIITPDKTVYSTQSVTFKRSFLAMYDMLDGKFSCIKVSGTTKAGRPYIDCTLDKNSVQ